MEACGVNLYGWIPRSLLRFLSKFRAYFILIPRNLLRGSFHFLCNSYIYTVS